jgi:hypothetical protein
MKQIFSWGGEPQPRVASHAPIPSPNSELPLSTHPSSILDELAKCGYTTNDPQHMPIPRNDVTVELHEPNPKPAISAIQAKLNAAKQAQRALTIMELTELKAMKNPPALVKSVLEAIMVVLSYGKSGLAPVNSEGRICDRSFPTVRSAILTDVSKTSKALLQLKMRALPKLVLEELKPYIESPKFTLEHVRYCSVAAAGLCHFILTLFDFLLLKYNTTGGGVAAVTDTASETSEHFQSTLHKTHFIRHSDEDFALVDTRMKTDTTMAKIVNAPAFHNYGRTKHGGG